MAELNQAQNGGAATVERPAPASQGNAGTTTNQPANGAGAGTQDGNSGPSDGANGSSQDGNGTGQRPSRSERRIGALHGELAEALTRAETAEQEAARYKQMLETPIGDRVRMPDYSGVDQVTPEQLKQDIINTADQIVKLRLQEGLIQNSQVLTQRQSNERVLDDIKTVIKEHEELDPSNEEAYDPDLEQYLVGSFKRAYKGDNTYRLKEHIDAYFSQNKPVKTTKDAGTDDKAVGAIRGQGGNRSTTGGKSIEEMSADEYRAYVSANKRH